MGFVLSEPEPASTTFNFNLASIDASLLKDFDG
jgi:hypothetical protein